MGVMQVPYTSVVCCSHDRSRKQCDNLFRNKVSKEISCISNTTISGGPIDLMNKFTCSELAMTRLHLKAALLLPNRRHRFL